MKMNIISSLILTLCCNLLIQGAPTPNTDFGVKNLKAMGGCLMLKYFSAVIIFDCDDVVKKAVIHIPVSARVSDKMSHCSQDMNDNMTIAVEWSDKIGYEENLFRKVALTFSIGGKANTSSLYGLKKVEAEIEMPIFDIMKNNISSKETVPLYEEVTKVVFMSTGILDDLQIPVPLHRSSLCDNQLTLEMKAEMRKGLAYASSKTSERNCSTKSYLHIKSIKFDAFRPIDMPTDDYQPSVACADPENSFDLFPLEVGCVLSGAVLFIIISYLLGRRKKEQCQGYINIDGN